MKRWLIVTVGLGMAAAGAWVLLTSTTETGRRGIQAKPEPAHGDIREESKQRLRDILREADEEK